MKFLICFLGTFFFSSNLIFTQNKKITIYEKTDYEEAVFNQLEIRKNEYLAKQGIKEIMHFRGLEGSLKKSKLEKCRHLYNEKGNLVLTEFFYSDTIFDENLDKNDKPVIGTLKRSIKFEYDTLGNLLEEKEFSSNGELIKSSRKDVNRQIEIKTKLKLDFSKITYFSSLFDFKRHLSFFKNRFKFDKLKRLKRWTVTNKTTFEKSIFYYSYITNGFSRKEINYNSSNEINYYILSDYNSQGLEIKSTRYSKDNKIDYVNETAYKYFN